MEAEASDTRPLVLGIYDRQLATACRFLPVADGSLRCLPDSAAVEPLGTLFADDRCDQALLAWTRPIIASANRSEPPGLVAVQTGSSCAPTYVPRKAAKGGPGLPVFERSAAGECLRLPDDVTPSPSAGKEWLVAGEALSPSLFAEGRRVQLPPPAGQRLGIEQLESASGGPFVVGLHDQQWDRSCELERDNVDGGTLECWPPAAHRRWGRFLLFGDDACGTPLAGFWADDQACPDPALVRSDNQVSRIGARWTGSVFSTYDLPGICQPEVRDLGGTRAFPIGETLGPDAVAKLLTQLQGSGPLRFSAPASDDGRFFDLPVERLPDPLFGSSLYLAGRPVELLDARATSCTPFRVPDGTIRCLPTGEMALLDGLFYADAGCARPVVLCRDCNGTKLFIPAPSGDPFGGVVAIHEFGARYPEQIFSTGFSNDHLCRPIEPSQILPTDVFYELGAKVPFGQYPQLGEWRGAERVGPN